MRFNIRTVLIVIFSLLAVAAMTAVVVDVNSYTRSVKIEEPQENDETTDNRDSEDRDVYPGLDVYWPGVKQPQTLPAAEVTLQDDAEIIGVTVSGTSRAYLIDAFRILANTPAQPEQTFQDTLEALPKETFSQLVVNDWLNGIPITVTYCENKELIRVFTQSDQTGPLDVWLAELDTAKVVLNYEDLNYDQSSSDIPLQDYPFERMSWSRWMEQHPQTDLYLGEFQPKTGQLTGASQTLGPALAAADVVFRSIKLEYLLREEKELQTKALYRLLQRHPQFAPAHEFFAEYYADRGNEIMAQTHRNLARDAATAPKKNDLTSEPAIDSAGVPK